MFESEGVTPDQYRWLARKMLGRPNYKRIVEILVLSQHRKMKVQKALYEQRQSSKGER